MNGFFARGAAAAFLVAGASAVVTAQGTGGMGRADTVILRRADPAVRVRLDSMKVLMRLFDEEPLSSEASSRIRQALESLTVTMWRMQPGPFGPGGPGGPEGRNPTRLFIQDFDLGPRRPTGWLGITTVPTVQQLLATGHFVQYFTHPLIVSVDRNSPAQQAGILAGDSLVAYDGVDVAGRAFNITEMLTPDRKLAITVRRGGENKEYSVTIAKAPMRIVARYLGPDDDREKGGQVRRRGGEGGSRGGSASAVGIVVPGYGKDGPDGPHGPWGPPPRGAFSFAAGGVFGASMTTFESTIAEKLNLPAGVLVKNVPEASIAAKAGLEPGDVIVAVAGRSVASLPEVQMLVMENSANHSVTLTIVRDRKQKPITVSW